MSDDINYNLATLIACSKRPIYRDEYASLIQKLFQAALSKSPFDYLCTLVRVGGMQDAGWDPAFEIMRSFKDFSDLSRTSIAESDLKKYFRVTILNYCHALEMSATHAVIANLLRIVNGRQFTIDPFNDLHQRDKNNVIKRAAALGQKVANICTLADTCSMPALKTTITDVFNFPLRNSFSHSDYVMTDSEFRGVGHKSFRAKFDVLFDSLERYLAFFEAYFQVYDAARKKQNFKRFYKLPNFETLETLAHEEILVGFKVHFSNGSAAHFERTEGGVKAVNVMFEREGLSFMVGNLEMLEKKWKIDGKEVPNWTTLDPHL